MVNNSNLSGIRRKHLSQQVGPISIIVPAFNEVDSLKELLPRLKKVLVGISHELIIVDDGSTDGTVQFVHKVAKTEAAMKALVLRRNLGKSMALAVGFECARYPIVVTLDADLQDRPEDIAALVGKLDEGYDLVSGQRAQRHDGLIRKFVSWLFNCVVSRLTGLKFKDLNCGLKAYRSEVVKTVPVYGQFHRYIPLLAHMAGFKVTEEAVTNEARKYGESKYKAFRYGGIWDLFSILFTYNYKFRPLHFFAQLSLFFLIPSTLIILYLIAGYLHWRLGGMVDEPILFIRPLLTISLTMFVVGAFVFVSGFICDFILHHVVSSNIGHISSTSVRAVIETDDGTRK
jgi:glycosyltransferase involved in cell wall biosynthesis